MQIALAPMEGLVDDILRDILTQVGGIDWCVSEFVRVTDRILPRKSFLRLAPELLTQAKTPVGTSMRLQLLGSDPSCLADNAAYAFKLGAPVVDFNFGCPAKTVNKSRGGAVLLEEPELLFQIMQEVRATVPVGAKITAKMRLGLQDKSKALDCARALAEGGAQQLVVHARTKAEGYKPPAHWEWVAQVKQVVDCPVYANGDIWSVEDWHRCRAVSGVDDVMIGRGLVWQPDLAAQILAVKEGRSFTPYTWREIAPLVAEFWRQARIKINPQFAPGRLKQWLALLGNRYPEARQLFNQLRTEKDCTVIDQLLLQTVAQ